jgi:peptidoglycan hydrolase-like protein with peptidoglycan-binding domain
MQRRKFRILSVMIAGSLALAVAAITASSGTSQPATHAALAAQTESFPPVNLDDCPTLHPGYPTGGCVAQLQTDLNSIQGHNLTVDGTFGPVNSQTYDAVIAFQQAHSLQQDGLVGLATKQALDAALAGSTPMAPPATASASPVLASPAQAPSPASSAPATPATAPAAGTSTASATGLGNEPHVTHCGITTCTRYFTRAATKRINADVQEEQNRLLVFGTLGPAAACGIAAAALGGGIASVVTGAVGLTGCGAWAADKIGTLIDALKQASDANQCFAMKASKGLDNFSFVGLYASDYLVRSNQYCTDGN